LTPAPWRHAPGVATTSPVPSAPVRPAPSQVGSWLLTTGSRRAWPVPVSPLPASQPGDPLQPAGRHLCLVPAWPALRAPPSSLPRSSGLPWRQDLPPRGVKLRGAKRVLRDPVPQFRRMPSFLTPFPSSLTYCDPSGCQRGRITWPARAPCPSDRLLGIAPTAAGSAPQPVAGNIASQGCYVIGWQHYRPARSPPRDSLPVDAGGFPACRLPPRRPIVRACPARVRTTRPCPGCPSTHRRPAAARPCG
jgi:hypothetical protein